LTQFERAIADDSRAIMLDPNNSDAFYNRGRAYGNSGQFKLAAADFDHVYAMPTWRRQGCSIPMWG
jgi:tetratricopeptide (TPR) repeat protein